MKHLLIRADAGPQIGTGHVMRCLALAQAWQDAGGAVTCAMGMDAPAVKARLGSEGLRVVSIPDVPGSQGDARRTIALAYELGAQWVVVDGYHFHDDYQRAIKEAGVSLLWIDDEAHAGHYTADIVLNQNLHAAEAMYAERESYTQLLLGPRYVLLRREFLRWRDWQREIPEIARKVLVTLGGSDPDNVTRKVIEALQQVDIDDLETVVVVGASNPYDQDLAAAARVSRVPIRVERNAANMPQLMSWTDVAISGGGSTCWELAFMGLPSLVLPIAANQLPMGEQMQKAGVAVNLGWHADQSSNQIATSLRILVTSGESRAAIAKQARACVDGRGAGRVAAEMNSRTIRLRRAEQADCALIWQWANDPVVRAASFSSEPIPCERHAQWFTAKLHDTQCLFFIASKGTQEPMGQIRFDLDNNQAVVSLTVAPERRGQGLGKQVIRLASQQVFRSSPVHSIHAYIKPSNNASLRAFEGAGFERVGQTTIQGHDAIHLVIRPERL